MKYSENINGMYLLPHATFRELPLELYRCGCIAMHSVFFLVWDLFSLIGTFSDMTAVLNVKLSYIVS